MPIGTWLLGSSARAILALIASLALATSLEGRVTDAYDDGLLVTPSPVIGGSGARSDWLKVETDACGFPDAAQNSRSLRLESGFRDDADPPEAPEDLEDLAPADKAWALMAMSLSAHSEIAVISDGVGKTCDDSPMDDGDAGPESMAAWDRHPSFFERRPVEDTPRDYIV